VFSVTFEPAGKHAVCYDPRLSPQRPAVASHLWGPDGFTSATHSLQTR